MFMIILGVGAYVTYTLNLWGPMLSMTNAASAQAIEEFKKRLREFLESTEAGRQTLAMSSGEEVAMKKLSPTGKQLSKDDDDEDEI
jgi:protein SEY1